MPRIHTITTDTVLSDNDMLLGTDGAQGANNATKNFSFGVFKNYITSNVTFTGDTFVSGGNFTLDNNYYLRGKLTNGTAIDLIGVKSNNLVTISDDAQETHIGPINGNTNFQVNGAFVLTGAAVLNGDVQIGGDLTVNGTINLGDANTDNIVFGAEVDSHIIPDDDVTYNLGSSSKKWDTLFANRVELASHAGVGGNLTVTGNTTLNGYVTLGDAGSDIISVAGITAFNAAVNVGQDGDGHIVNIYGDTSGRKIDFDPTGNASLNFTDTTMAKFGNSGDLQIYHNGTHNYIDSNGGQMFLRASVSDGKMYFMGDNGNGGYTEYFYIDGSTAVYDGNQGQAVSVETRFPPDAKATFGITGSMQTSLWNSNSGNFFMSETGGGNMYFQTDGTEIVFSKRGSGATHQAPLTGAETMAKFIIDGGVELYHDNAKKLETTATGITVTGSIAGALNTTGGTLHDPTFTGTVTSNANLIVLAGQDTAAQVELKADAGDNNDDHWKLSAEPNATFKILTRDGGTYSSAVDFIASNKNAYFKGDISVLDNKKLLVGGGSDLQIFHDGTDSYVSDTGDGNLYLKGGNQVRIVGDAANSDEIWAVFGSDAAELWYNGNKKLETTSSGIQTTGSINIHGAYSFPITDGTSGQVLKTNGSGVLSFQDDSGSLLGIQEGGEFTNSLIVGHTGTGTLDAAQGNTGLGVGAMNAITSGDNNVALGHDALGAVTTGSDNTGVGKQALYTLEGSRQNVAIGKDALYNANSQDANQYPDNGSQNVAIGYNAGSQLTNGMKNTFIGWEAGKNFVSGQKNICIGHGAGVASSNSAKFNSIAIGNDVQISKSNSITIGSTEYDRTRIYALHDMAGLISSASTALTINDSGKTYEQAGNPSNGYTVTLPDAGTTLEAGWHVEFVMAQDATNNFKVVAEDTSADKIIGYVQCINASTGATTIFRALSTDNYSAITFNGGSQGATGSHIKLVRSIYSNRFMITGTLICTTTPANPFSTT